MLFSGQKVLFFFRRGREIFKTNKKLGGVIGEEESALVPPASMALFCCVVCGKSTGVKCWEMHMRFQM